MISNCFESKIDAFCFVLKLKMTSVQFLWLNPSDSTLKHYALIKIKHFIPLPVKDFNLIVPFLHILIC
jgi:hypothetical protein